MMAAIGDRDTAGALKLFSELYSEGKDASAMLDELSTLARDMLVVKTAPSSGLGMISSTCTAKEIQALSPKFTPAELLRIIDQISATAAGFKTSANQRIDGELCLIHLCQPELSLEPEDLSARLSRMEADLTARLLELEQKLKNGSFVANAAAPEEELPPPWEDADAPPEPEPKPPEAQPDTPPDEHWQKVKERVLPGISSMLRSLFETQISGQFRGDELLLIPQNSYVRDMLKKFPDWSEPVQKAATVVMGKPIRVRLGEAGAAHSGDMFFDLAESMKGMDNITIHN
jgi:DNA polymerase III gamma/tau subunit